MATPPTVDFVIGGAQKGGTTAMDDYLRAHPEICMARKNSAYFSAAHPEISIAGQKEVHFFDNEAHFLGRLPDYAQYHQWFDPQPAHRLLGETTPIYLYWQAAPRRIREYNPKMKFILLLRDPIERAYSHWNMERIRNADTLSFWDAITSEAQRCLEARPLQHRVYSYISRGLYTQQLHRIWTYFPRDQVLCLKSESLKTGRDETLRRVCDFLQVSPFTGVAPRTAHALPYESGLTDRERDYLRQIFRPEVRQLEQELNWDCSDWL